MEIYTDLQGNFYDAQQLVILRGDVVPLVVHSNIRDSYGIYKPVTLIDIEFIKKNAAT